MSAAPKLANNLNIQIAEGKKLHLAGDLESAQVLYEKALKKAPGNLQLLSLLGGLLLQRKHYEKAIKPLKRACAKNRSDADLPYNLGLALYHCKDYPQAIEYYQHCITMAPSHDRAYYMLARCYLAWDYKKYRPQALAACLKDIEITDRLDSHIVAAEILHVDGKNEEVRGIAKRILELDAQNEIGLFLLAKTIISDNYTKNRIDIRHAEPIIKIANLILKIHPKSWRGHHLMGEALAMVGENELAIRHYEKVNQILPGFAVSRTNTGVLLLKQGRLQEGWEEIANRKHHGAELYGMDIDALQRCPGQFWNGETVAGSSVLIASEQGIGDQLLHGQMLKELLDAGMHIHMTCTGKIKSILSRSLPRVKFYDTSVPMDQSVLDKMDFKAELLDLGKYLRADFDQFEHKFYYLKPDPGLAAEFSERYAEFGSKLKVGIAWKSASRSVGSIKSTQLMDWRSILTIEGIQFINIQYGPVEEIKQVKDQLGVEIYEDDFDPFDDIEKALAQISALDMVISVSNASVHMSGQLNIPTWVILNSRPLWHWFEKGDRSPWYDSLTLYRQQQLQSWGPVLSSVADDLRLYAANR